MDTEVLKSGSKLSCQSDLPEAGPVVCELKADGCCSPAACGAAAAAVKTVAKAGRAWRRSEIERSIGSAVEALMKGNL